MLRRTIAFVGHLPGLWLVYREGIPHALRRPNLLAVGATLAAMGVAGVGAPAGSRGWAVLITWGVGHFAWGAYLAFHLPPPHVSDAHDDVRPR